MIYIGCDHAAFEIKQQVLNLLDKNKFNTKYLGTNSSDRCDYPDFAINVVKQIKTSDDRGILICGSGIGMSMVANRFKNIRAALCRTIEDATLSRQHNNSNVLCLGARITSIDDIYDIILAWLNEGYHGGRHDNRIDKFNLLGQNA